MDEKTIDPRRLRSHARRVAALACVALLVALACSEDATAPSVPPEAAPAKPASPASASAKPASAPAAPLDPAALASEGRGVYMGNCIACHNPDPSVDGALGPAVKGSSRELLYARVVNGDYPEGYTPKRPTRVMVALPHLEPKIDALAAYLAD